MRAVLKWMLLCALVLFGVFSATDDWKRIGLARRECAENPMPGLDRHECIIVKWLRRRNGGEDRQRDR
jgi:hypothetical protein